MSGIRTGQLRHRRAASAPSIPANTQSQNACISDDDPTSATPSPTTTRPRARRRLRSLCISALLLLIPLLLLTMTPLPFAQPPNVRPLTQTLSTCASALRSLPFRARGGTTSAAALPAACVPGDGALAGALLSLFGAAPASAAEAAGGAAGLDARAPALRHPPADRIVAIGDVHGDMRAFRRSLRAAGVVDEHGAWAGGKTVLVQVGDQLDRGNDEREIYETLFRLQDAAPAAGGAVHIVLGNHELCNLQMDYRYVTQGGFKDFERDGGVTPLPRGSKLRVPPGVAKQIKQLPKSMQARARALCPGGPLAVELGRRAQVAVMVGDNVFVHGGLQPKHLVTASRTDPDKNLERLNNATTKFMMGLGNAPHALRGGSSPVWMRDYSRQGVRPGSDACRMLAETLKLLKAKRMIVGHTPQERGINAACGGRVWRVDTGMSAAYGGMPEALEISKGGRLRIFNPEEGAIQGSARAR